ncbi:MAG TPA: hypothetical protein VHT25_04020 [Solirubrobacteraceae bacterium]|nr:hypothetical protein [Solirubrobacteraceae bacterium]
MATGISSLQYASTGSGEEEGTWTYRVQGFDSSTNLTTAWSPTSQPVKIDKTPPTPPTASPDRAPDYAGGGGFYKDTVTVSFSEASDPLLSDGSSGSGINPASISSPQTFTTDASHTAQGTEADNVGNLSSPASLTVQVDASAPTVEISCPATTPVGSKASATVSASDGQSGLASNPSGSVAINTSKAGPQTIQRTATDNVGHQTTTTCTTEVLSTKVITGHVKGKLIVKKGEAVQLTQTAVANAIEVLEGGSLDVEGATTKTITAIKAGVMRICGASTGAVKVQRSSGSVTIGDGSGCAGSNIKSATVYTNHDGVSVVANTIAATAKVQGNGGGTTVQSNTIAANLTVLGNAAPTVDKPNTVGGASKLQ